MDNENKGAPIPLTKIRTIIQSALTVVSQHSQPLGEEFSEDHPWMKPFVTEVGKEVFQKFSRIASDPKEQAQKITCPQIPDDEKQSRKEKGLNDIIRFRVFAGGEEIIFTFEEVEKRSDDYIFLE